MATKYSKWSLSIPTFKGPPKFTQIWDFWFENKPSGNPDGEYSRIILNIHQFFSARANVFTDRVPLLFERNHILKLF
jgi:hypothetical protein